MCLERYSKYHFLSKRLFKIANAYDEGRKTMDGAWEIMELHFWDENAGLYKVVSKIQF